MAKRESPTRARTLRVHKAVPAAAALCLLLPVQAGPVLIGNDANSLESKLYDVDPATGATSNPRGVGFAVLAGIAIAGNGDLFGLSAITTNARLYSIDPVTGSSVIVASTGLFINEADVDFDPTTGTLFGVGRLTFNFIPSLFTIDIANDVTTVVGEIPGGGDPSAMAFDAAGNLFVLDTLNDKLMQIDKTDAGVISTIDLSTPLGPLAGLEFEPGTAGTLFAADGGSGGTDQLYTLDTVTGVLTAIGPLGLSDGLAGLAFLSSGSPCPADLDGDGTVGIVDFLALLAAWGTDPGGPPDLDGDGNVGIVDFLELLANWGPCP